MVKNEKNGNKGGEDFIPLGFLKGNVGLGINANNGTKELVISQRQLVVVGEKDGKPLYQRKTVRIRIPASEIQEFRAKLIEAEEKLGEVVTV